MLVEFTVGNYRSFYEPKTFSMQARGINDIHNPHLATYARKKHLLTSAVYGANSSGKSNLVHAIKKMSEIIRESVRLNKGDVLSYDPFLLHNNSSKEPTLFEATFVKDEYQYRYGFEYTKYKIEREWLFKKKGQGTEKPLFIRNNEGIGVIEEKFSEGVGLEERTNENRLFLSLCSQLGGEISTKVIYWFMFDLNTVSGLQSQQYTAISNKMFMDKGDESEDAIKLFRKLKLGFHNIYARKDESKKYQEDMSERAKEFLESLDAIVESEHDLYDDSGEVCGNVKFPFEERESAGSIKLYEMSGPIFYTLHRGGVLFIDELDAKMHPLISQEIVRLFNDPKRNPNKAQLIFTTHDTNLLSTRLLRRDQIWFTEKDSQEQTDLYSMMDIQFADGSKPRNDSNYEKNYIAGRYGAIPYIIYD